MTVSSRRGFTLAELMITLVVTLAVGAVTYRLLLTNQRITRSQTEQVGLQDNVRSGALIIGAELREVGYDRLPAAADIPASLVPYPLGLPGSVRSDLVASAADSVRYKAMRGFAITCGFNAGTSRIVVESGSLSTTRALAVGDSLLVYVEGKPGTAADDLWLHGAVTSLAPNQLCADGLTNGLAVGVAFDGGVPAATAFGEMSSGGPVRFFEEMVLRSYRDGGSAWLGIRSVLGGAAFEPVLGPIADGAVAPEGLALSWLDVNGAATAVAANVRSVGVTLRGITDMPVHINGQGYAAVDSLSLSTRVALRNALR
jgi:prepilin-type N-terminal cleavage/methylation domain-containing protein